MDHPKSMNTCPLSRVNLLRALQAFLGQSGGVESGRRRWPDLHPHHALALAENLTVAGRHHWINITLYRALSKLSAKALLKPFRETVPEPIAKWADAELSASTLRHPARRLLWSRYLIDRFDRVWRRNHAIPLIRIGSDLILLCQTEAEARVTRREVHKVLTEAAISFAPNGGITTDLRTDERAACFGYGIRLDVGELEITIANTGWRWLDCLATRRTLWHPTSSVAQSVMRSFIRCFAPAFTFVDSKAAHARLAAALESRGTPMCVSHGEMRSAWRGAHRRWRRLTESRSSSLIS